MIPKLTYTTINHVNEHHHGSDLDAVMAIFNASILVDTEEAAIVMRRRRDSMSGEYRVAADRRGLFIVVTNPHHCRPNETVRIVIEYARFGPAQVAKAWELWPASDSAFADAREAV